MALAPALEFGMLGDPDWAFGVWAIAIEHWYLILKVYIHVTAGYYGPD